MWLCLPDAFLSIVHKECADDELLVRARRRGDIERVFPHAKVVVNRNTDYMFRARVKRTDVADALMTQAATIDYPNFKNEVADDDLHNAYSAIWNVMYRLQNALMGDRRERRQRPMFY
jgi:hypothetical protein